MDNITSHFKEYDIEKWSNFVYTVFYDDTRWFKIFSITLLICIFIAGLFVNTLICVVICNDKKMHTATNFYIINMAVSDALVSFGILLEIHNYVTNSYAFGSITCKIHFFFLELLWNNSILVMTALTIERYLAVQHPLLLKSVSTWRRVLKVLILLWIIGICETVPELLTIDLLTIKNVTICSTVPSSLAKVVYGIKALVTFAIPLMIMLFVYIMIAIKVNSSENLCSKRKKINHESNKRKVNKLVVTITLSFIISWLPYFIFRIMFIVSDMEQFIKLERVLSIGSRLIMLNSWFGIVLNPILFSFGSTKFRRALKVLWKTKIRRQQHLQMVTLN